VKAVEELFPQSLRRTLVELRRTLHRYPELSGKEERTAAALHAALARIEPAPARLERVAGTGVVARIPGRDGSRAPVAVRGDIDALPISESTGLPFASEHPGVMHACGHDVHATWAVGAAHLLAARPAAGDVLILLQPAEETGRGANAVLESGALDGVAAIFGAHVDRRFAVGEVVAQEGPLAADPIVGAAALIGALQTIVARRVNPAYPAVVSVGSVRAGSAPNVIPDRATLTGTLRATDPDTRRLLVEEVRRIAEATAAVYRLNANFSIELGPPPLVNPPEPAGWARRAATAVLGDAGVVPLGFVNMGGEDFAAYLERIPGCFLRIGAREPGGEPIPAHSPRFYAAEESIFVGAAVLAETARIASEAVS